MPLSKPRALASLPITPWKNGDGSTRALAVEPHNAGLDDFLWRISLAEVNRVGAFSLFPNVDRTILLWRGNGIALHAASWSHTLDQPLLSFTFRGEESITCDLINGPTTDLNVMVRRGAVAASVHLYRQEVSLPAHETLIVLCASGSVCLGHGHATVNADEFIRIDRCAAITLTPSTAASVFLVIALRNTTFGR